MSVGEDEKMEYCELCETDTPIQLVTIRGQYAHGLQVEPDDVIEICPRCGQER